MSNDKKARPHDPRCFRYGIEGLVMVRIFLGMSFAAFSVLSAAHDASHEAKHGTANSSAAEVTAFGRVGNPGKITRTIRVEMSDKMRFSPSVIDLKQNETARFVVKNSGKVLHEMVLGTMDDIKQHSDLMKKHPGMEHDELHMAHVPPGKSRTIVWQFTEAGTFHYGCLVAGHFEAGMVGEIRVFAKGNNQ